MGKNGKENKGKKKEAKSKKANPTVPPPTQPFAITDDSQQSFGIGLSSNSRQDLSGTTICSFCGNGGPSGEWYVQCDDCDQYFHFKCVGYVDMPEEESWNCPECRDSAEMGKSQPQSTKLGQNVDVIVESMNISEQSSSAFIRNVHQGHRTSSFKAPPTKSVLTSTDRPNTPQVVNDTTSERSKEPVSEKMVVSASVYEQHKSALEMPLIETDPDKNGRTDEAHSTKAKQNHREAHCPSVKSKRSTSSRASSHASSQRRREIEIQRFKEQFDLQTRLDEERLALERKAIDMKERREKQLMELKYRAMQEASSVGSESSTESKTIVHSKKSNGTKRSAQSELVSSWLENQRKQNQPADEHDEDLATEGFGLDFSIPVEKRELEQIQRLESANINSRFSQLKTTSNDVECDGVASDATFVVNSIDLTSSQLYKNPINDPLVSKTQKCSSSQRNVQYNHPTSSQHCENTNSNSQPLANNQQRISWNFKSQQAGLQSTKVNQPVSGQSYNSRGNQNLGSQQSIHGTGITTTQSNQIPSQTYSDRGNQNFVSQQAVQHNNVPQSPMSGALNVQAQRRVTSSQLASRQAMPKELPVFYGHPHEWAQFIKRYENTTSLCGFSDDENLERLNKCLKGKAREIVESQLIMPECVQEIIDTLREKFGRPELIAKSTLAKIRAEPVIKQDKLETLSDFGYKVRNACNVIESMGLHYYLYNPELIQDIVGKLPYQTKIDWARYAEGIGNPINLRVMAEWLHKLSRTLNQISTPDMESTSNERKTEKKADNVKGGFLNVHSNNPQTFQEKFAQTQAQSQTSKCESCSKDCKNLGECAKFKLLNVDDRWKVVKDHKICRKCLQKHGRTCTKDKLRACGVSGCDLKHHSLLHNKERHSKFEKSGDVGTTNSNAVPRPHNTHQVNGDDELFRVLPVILHNAGTSIETFAFLDEGSSYTLMEKETANQLNIKGKAETICLLWTNGIHRQQESEIVNLEISGINDLNVKHQLRGVNVVENLELATQSVDPEALEKRFKYLKGLPLAKYSNAIPTILIGLRHIRLSTPLESIEGGEHEPIASRARLGWTVYGPVNGKGAVGHVNHHKVKKCPCKDRDDDLHKTVKDHFTIENFGVSIKSMNMESKENQKVLEMMKKFTVRKGNRFETRLLWKNETYVLPDSYPMARKRLACVENKGEEVVNVINDIIKDYLTKGYASKLSTTDLVKKHPRTFYLPIFTVTNPKKPGKIRPVFDAAATVNGTSLNSALLTGPDLLSSLVDVLRRFREHQIAVTGDIKEMFHQVLINEADRHSQRFLWRNGDKSREPDVYQFNVMTFGSKCSPSSAQFIKNKNAAEYEPEYPRAAKSIIENHYVDDMLDGAKNIQEAIRLINDVKFIHDQAGFEIRNFKSNSEEVLKAIGEPIEASKVDLVEGTTNVERVLGMFWETKSDCFMYSLKYTKVTSDILKGKVIPTKRELLRLVMSLFDPLGLVSYYVIHAKCLLQNIWRTKISWDEKLPEHLVEYWHRWIELLPQVERLKIPRWYSTKLASEEVKKIELHIFVDAGDDAFAAVAYLRVVDKDGIDCSLIGSKSRVTPLKYLSVPRKELMAAVLGSRLVNSVENGLSLKIDRRVIWSDSNTALTWLHSEHKRYSQFVAHRIGEILENTNLKEWRWVPSKLNVSDEATKWSKKPTFEASNRWFTGPDFLRSPECEWPKPKAIIPNGTTEEMKASHSHSKLIIPSLVNATGFSTWYRLVRAVANAKRIAVWLVAKQKKLAKPTLTLSQEDLLDSERRLIRQAQWEGFTEEMVILTRNQLSDTKNQKSIDNGSAIRDCSPYLDEFGTLRVKGRIDSATAVTSDAKRPIILPKTNAITKLIVLSYHIKFKHQNHESVVNELRQKFYIPQIRTVLKGVRWSCKRCALKRCKPKPPQMADLPALRFEAGIRPYTYTGIDYFGPLSVRVGRQTHKRWGIIYTCLTIRAIWIDVVPSYDTQACILSIRDFVNRNGVVQEFFTDNGSNFVGANNELTREMQKIDQQRLSAEFTSCYTKWNFNPPETPHMGGMWERLIQTVKSSLYESMITRTPTDQVLKSWLIEVENIVNSRPLTYVPLDSEEDEALTPNHFIHGSSNGMKPPGNFKTDGPYLRDQWKEVQRCTNIFWKRFIHEYVPTLVRRTKWFDPVKPLEVGDLVINFDEDAPRNTYTRGRVVETKIGTNNQVRRAKIQFGNGSTLWRSAHNLGLLDVSAAPSESFGLDHLKDEINRGENVGATISIASSNLDTSNAAQSVRSVRR